MHKYTTVFDQWFLFLRKNMAKSLNDGPVLKNCMSRVQIPVPMWVVNSSLSLNLSGSNAAA